MTPLALDTNAYSAFKRGHEAVVDAIARSELVLLPLPVFAELRIGFRGGSQEARNLRELEQFLASPRVRLCTLGEHTGILFAEIFGRLRRKGTPIPLNDIWIASCAMEHGAILLSADAHFTAIDGLLLNVPL
ncbi:MAG: type II toxin-antitoxin system VapC family toxin [Spirochaetota bacterium]